MITRVSRVGMFGAATEPRLHHELELQLRGVHGASLRAHRRRAGRAARRVGAVARLDRDCARLLAGSSFSARASSG